MTISTQPSRFYDAEDCGELQLQLQSVGAEFKILRRFGYRDPHYPEPFIIPADPVTFRTDLASIPWFFAWLVPGLGTHLPAILVHDALVLSKGEAPAHIGPPVTREQADRILRDAMASLGTPVIRRWLIWTAVTLATAVTTLKPRWYWPTVVIGSLLIIVALGTLATLDLLGVWNVLPWMGDRPLPVELGLGALFAVLIPAMLSLLWLRLWKAGVITGIALALLLHVTAAVIVVYGIYWVAEWLVSAAHGTEPSPQDNLENAAA